MDYSGFSDFPFPSKISGEEERAKHFFMALPDDEQLVLLNGCQSYEDFRFRVYKRMDS